MTGNRKSAVIALPLPISEAADLSSRLGDLLEQHAASVAQVATASEEFRAAEQTVRRLRQERDKLRNPGAVVIARAVKSITEAEIALAACERTLIEAEERRASVAGDITQVRSELDTKLATQVGPLFEAAHSDFMNAVESLTTAWIRLNAAAEAADLELSIRPSIESPVGHEILTNPKILEPKIADAIGDRWRSIRGVLNQARRVA